MCQRGEMGNGEMTMDPIYLYVDGESYYIGTERAVKKAFQSLEGKAAPLASVRVNPAASSYERAELELSHHGRAKFFGTKACRSWPGPLASGR
jgi:hypothetical protein